MSRLVPTLVCSVLVCSCFEFTGCQYRSKQDTYILISQNLKLPYWKTLQDGFTEAAAEYHVTGRVEGPQNYDPAGESDAFSRAVAGGPAGILVSAADAGALRGDIATAVSNGIPVITVDSDAPLSARLLFVGTNNLEAGHLGGRRLVEKLHGKGTVVFYTIEKQPNIEDRLQGYRDIFADNPGIRIVDVVSTGGDAGSAFDKTQDYAKRTGKDKVDAFVALESESGKEIAEVLKRNNMTDRIVIAMDVDPDTLKLISEGSIDSTVSQKPWTMGYVGLRALDDAHHMRSHDFRSDYSTDFNSPFPAFIDTGSALITKDNVSLFQHPLRTANQ